MQHEDLPFYDPIHPLEGLERAGIQTRKGETTTATNALVLGGLEIPLGATSGEHYHFALAQPAGLNVVFGKESVLKKLGKLFSKELQVGDSSFDSKVYITTSNKESTLRFLKNDDVKALVLELVGDGGTVAVNGSRVDVHALSKGAACIVSERDLARFVCQVLAFE